MSRWSRRWKRRCSVLAERGATVSRFDLPLMDAVAAYGGIVSRVEAAPIHAEWMRSEPQVYGAAYQRPDVSRLCHSRGLLHRGAQPPWSDPQGVRGRGLFEGRCAGDADHPHLPADPGGDRYRPRAAGHRTSSSWRCRRTPGRSTTSGLPAISVPCGFDPNGCPIGLQIAGRPFGEGRILNVAGAYQSDTHWHWAARRSSRPPHEQAESRLHRHRRHDLLARPRPAWTCRTTARPAT